MSRSVVKSDLDAVRQIAAAQAAKQAPDAAEEEVEAPVVLGRSRGDEFPIYFYNSRYPNEYFYEPNDANKHAGSAARGFTGRTFGFERGQFIATEKWQADILRKVPHVFEADSDEVHICEACGYGTRSFRDYKFHTKQHLT